MKETIGDAFRARGLRCTPQRFFVMEYLMRHHVHATAEDIFHAVNRTDPRASRATVYNALHALSRTGLVSEFAVNGTAARFDANVDRHHHFICDRCGAVEDVGWFDPPTIGRRVRDFEAIFRGVCAGCSELKTTRKRSKL